MPRAKGKGGKPKKNKFKLKTKRVCRRKFKVTGTGKLMKGKIGVRKLLRNKPKTSPNSKESVVTSKFSKMIKKCFLHISGKKKR